MHRPFLDAEYRKMVELLWRHTLSFKQPFECICYEGSFSFLSNSRNSKIIFSSKTKELIEPTSSCLQIDTKQTHNASIPISILRPCLSLLFLPPLDPHNGLNLVHGL